MKRLITTIITLAAIIADASAQNLSVQPIEVQTGEQTEMVVNLTGGTSATALQFNLQLPEGVTVETNSAILGAATDGHTLSVQTLDSGDQLFILYSIDFKPFKDGELLRIPVTAGSTEATTNGKLYKARTATADAVSHTCAEATFSATVSGAYKLGDVNGDGSVSVTDVTMVISHILGKTPEGFNAAVADVNSDGSISVTDVTMIINIILKGDIPEETKYYWYVGHENPANMTSITALSSNAASAGAGWRTIGTTLPTYSKTNPLWTASDQIVTASSKSTMYVALPSETIKSRNDITGEDVTSDGWTINPTKKTLNGVQYTIWTSISGKKSFSETLY